MLSKNSEAPTALTVEASNLPVNLRGKTNMNSLTKSDLNFHGVALTPVAEMPGIWLTANQLGCALEYADDKAVQRIYSRHSDEFTVQMTQVVRVTTPGGAHDCRVFSIRGSHLIAMFARTSVAKEFRRWLLDILDRQSTLSTPLTSQPSERELHAYNVQAMFDYFRIINDTWKLQIEPALRTIESPLAGRLHDRFSDGMFFMTRIKQRALGELREGEIARIR
jgi:prophage antirepressor-like protein